MFFENGINEPKDKISKQKAMKIWRKDKYCICNAKQKLQFDKDLF
jgi:hypothetical protein